MIGGSKIFELNNFWELKFQFEKKLICFTSHSLYKRSSKIIILKLCWVFRKTLGKYLESRESQSGPDKLYRKIPWDFLRGKTPKFRGMCPYYFLVPPNIFHNFVSFHPILMFFTNLESGDKTNNIVDEFKTIRLIQINT